MFAHDVQREAHAILRTPHGHDVTTVSNAKRDTPYFWLVAHSARFWYAVICPTVNACPGAGMFCAKAVVVREPVGAEIQSQTRGDREAQIETSENIVHGSKLLILVFSLLVCPR